jgi:hypothetical protein
MAKTVAKYTESHDRLTLSVKFADGSKLRFNMSRGGSSMSASVGVKQEDLTKIFREFSKCQNDESNGQRFKRAKAHFESFDSVQAAAAAL